MMMNPHGSATAEWQQNWRVVFAAALGVALSTVPIYSLGVMIVPLEQDLGWTRTEISSGKMIMSLFGISMGPFIGMAVDRLGSRRIAIASSILVCLAIAMMSTTGTNIGSWWFRWTVLSMVGLGLGPIVWTTAISSLFEKSRGLALAVSLCGTGLGSAITPMFAQYLVDEMGWRVAYTILPLVWGVLAIPFLVLWFSSRRDRLRLRRDSQPAAEVFTGLTIREGFHSFRFYKLAFAAAFSCLIVVALSINMVPILLEKGFSSSSAAAIAGLVGVMSIVGRLASGYLLDRVSARVVAAVSIVLPMLGCLLLLHFSVSWVIAIVVACLLGLALGAELDAVAYLASRHLGMKNFGVLFGTITGLISLGTGLGPMLASYAYDVTGSYDTALRMFVPGCAVAALLFLALGAYPEFRQAQSSS